MSITLQTNSLVTLEEYRIFRQEKIPNTVKSGSYTLALNAAIDYMEDFTNRTFLSGSLESEIFDGRGYEQRYEKAHSFQVLRQAPITSTPILYKYVSGTWTASTDTIEYDADQGAIYFPATGASQAVDVVGNLGSVGNFFDFGDQNHRVDYESGYSGSASAPSELKMVQMILGNHFTLLGEHQGVSQANKGNRITGYTFKIPDIVKQILGKYTLEHRQKLFKQKRRSG